MSTPLTTICWSFFAFFAYSLTRNLLPTNVNIDIPPGATKYMCQEKEKNFIKD